MIVNSVGYLSVLSGVDRGSVAVLISGGVKIAEVKQIEVYDSGDVKVRMDGERILNLHLRSGWRWEDGLIEF